MYFVKKLIFNKQSFLFLSIFIFAAVIRIFYLDKIPEGFDQAEAAFGYNTYSILHTGRDEYGKLLPIVLDSVGDYKLALFSYFLVPFIYFGGLTETSVRMAPAIAGLVSLFFTYKIVYLMFGRRKLALLAFFILSISPWHIVLSRIAYEAMLAVMFYLFSNYLFLLWVKKQKSIYFISSILALSLSGASYYSAWGVCLFAAIIYGLVLIKNTAKYTDLVKKGLLLLIPVVVVGSLFAYTHARRLKQINAIDVNSYPLLTEQIREDGHNFPLLFTRFLHNKVTFYPLLILQNLSNNFSLDYLFLSGDKVDRRFYVPYNGVFYLSLAPFFYLGILMFWKDYAERKNLVLLGLLLVVFLGSAFSEFGSVTQRGLLASPIISLFISYGILYVYNLTGKNILIKCIFTGLFLYLIYNLISFNHNYYWHASVHQPWGRNYGEKEMIESVSNLAKNYKKAVISGESYIFFYFYNKTDPSLAQTESRKIAADVNFLGHARRTNIGDYLTMPMDCPEAGKLNVLYVCQGRKIPQNAKIIKVITYRDNQPHYILLEFTPNITNDGLPPNYSYMENSGVIPDNENSYWH